MPLASGGLLYNFESVQLTFTQMYITDSRLQPIWDWKVPHKYGKIHQLGG